MLKKIIHMLTNIIIIAFIALAAVVMVASACGYKTYVIKSGSMEPALLTGSAVVVNENASYSEVEVGDIVAFTTETGARVTHRVINITEEGFETKGDNNDVSDGITTTAANFEGITYEACVPKVGYLLDEVSTKKGKIALLCGLGCLIVINLMTGTDDEKETKKVETEGE